MEAASQLTKAGLAASGLRVDPEGLRLQQSEHPSTAAGQSSVPARPVLLVALDTRGNQACVVYSSKLVSLLEPSPEADKVLGQVAAAINENPPGMAEELLVNLPTAAAVNIVCAG